jgi:hypothetical protein
MRVMTIKPGWRYCVQLQHHDGTGDIAFPYYTRRGAERFARKVAANPVMAGATFVVYRRHPWSRVIYDEPVARISAGA